MSDSSSFVFSLETERVERPASPDSNSSEETEFFEEGQRIEIDLEEYNQETDSEEDTLPDSSSWWTPCQPPDELAGPADSSWMWVPEIVEDDDDDGEADSTTP